MEELLQEVKALREQVQELKVQRGEDMEQDPEGEDTEDPTGWNSLLGEARQKPNSEDATFLAQLLVSPPLLIAFLRVKHT